MHFKNKIIDAMLSKSLLATTHYCTLVPNNLHLRTPKTASLSLTQNSFRHVSNHIPFFNSPLLNPPIIPLAFTIFPPPCPPSSSSHAGYRASKLELESSS